MLNQHCFHLVILIYQLFIEKFAFVQGRLTGLEHSGSHPTHQFADLILLHHISFVFTQDLFFFLLHLEVESTDFAGLLLMLVDLIIDEEFVVIITLARDDFFVILEQF
jgi:hypothetical protein